MKIVKLVEDLEVFYEQFMEQSSEATFYHTLKYREILKKFLGDEDYYLVAIDSENIVQGVMPLFIKKNKKNGNIINSLPFYGSIGSILSRDEIVKNALLIKYKEILSKYNCVSGTIVTSPFEENSEYYRENLAPQFVDIRIGQVTFLPHDEEELIKIFRVTTKKAIRKAMFNGIEVISTESEEIKHFLGVEHKRNMDDIGGISKPLHFFELISLVFNYGTDYKIYAAKFEGKIIAAVLLFYFKDTIEYFTPVITKEYRNYQPLSLLIFDAMKEGIKNGISRWNWGGTWLSQDGVYRFKSGWGAKDLQYYYFVNIMDEEVLKMDKQEVLEGYPYYYVYPWS